MLIHLYDNDVSNGGGRASFDKNMSAEGRNMDLEGRRFHVILLHSDLLS